MADDHNRLRAVAFLFSLGHPWTDEQESRLTEMLDGAEGAHATGSTTMTTATAPRPVARLVLEIGRPTVQGVTLARTECCDFAVQHVVDQSPTRGDSVFDLTAWFDVDGNQAVACACGAPLPAAGTWRP